MLNKRLKQKINAAAKRKIAPKYSKRVTQRQYRLREKYLKMFDSHPVVISMSTDRLSPEIGRKGTLYSFFGLPLQQAQGDVAYLRDIIKNTRLERITTGRLASTNVALRYKIRGIVSKKTYFRKTPMGGGIGSARSWVRRIETGQAGLQQFLWNPEKFSDDKRSVSKEALQAKSFGGKKFRVNGGPDKYKNTQFFTNLYNEYIDELAGIIRNLSKLK